ncbi:hypothetical protein GCM10011362_03450 [Marinobacter halophilus]|nr:hypothetical protein GCM10011362_03450 [Marinobacter halophilus]
MGLELEQSFKHDGAASKDALDFEFESLFGYGKCELGEKTAILPAQGAKAKG